MNIIEFITTHAIKFVDLRFTDLLGQEHHISVPAHVVTEKFLREGKMFDGSSMAGWKGVEESDMVLLPDAAQALYIDPFFEDPTLILRCDVLNPHTMKPYNRDPRAIAKAAEAHLQKLGIGDTFLVGPEPEFFIFDDIRWSASQNEASYHIDAKEGAWNSNTQYPEGNLGRRPAFKGGYLPLPPVDSLQNIRSHICETLEALGLIVETHHHEVATAGQVEIGTECRGLLAKADEMQIFKYVAHNVAEQYGKSVTFMPKPLAGDNGSGMHVHQSILKDRHNLFAGQEYGGLSKLALYFIGGIFKHAKAINAFTNPTTNSYRRLVPGFEAPTVLAYSKCNRSVAIRLPYSPDAKNQHIEVRFPDPSANPYLGFTALLMAGLDGIQKQIDPGPAWDHNAYELEEGDSSVTLIAASLNEAIEALNQDRDFLKAGDVMDDDLIDAYISLKRKELDRYRMTPHPVEFAMYY